MKINTTLKRYLFITIMVVTSLVVCQISYENALNNKVMEVNSTPISNRIVVLDAGHGLPDEGAIGFSGTTEQAINLNIVLKLQKLIEQSGAKVILTRSDENGIYSVDSTSIRNKKISDIKNREYITDNSGADVYVSIHLNKYQDSKYSGWQTFYQPKNENSKKLATIVQEQIGKNMDETNNRIPMAIKGVYLMEHIDITGIVVECGFISNPKEEQLLKEDSYQNKLAWGIYTGIQQYFQELNNMEE